MWHGMETYPRRWERERLIVKVSKAVLLQGGTLQSLRKFLNSCGMVGVVRSCGFWNTRNLFRFVLEMGVLLRCLHVEVPAVALLDW